MPNGVDGRSSLRSLYVGEYIPNNVDEVKLRIERVLLMSLGVAAPFKAARLPFDGLRDGLRDGFWETSVESEERSNGRRAIGRKSGGDSCDIVEGMLFVVCLLQGVRFALEVGIKAVKAVEDAPKLKYS